jgi:lysylphosphatidylglycerol synthetase-like protein (DUF2156 family)
MREAWDWLKRHADRILFILSILFVVLVGFTVLGLIVSACLFRLTSEYTLAARYSYIFRAVATLIAPIVAFLTSRRQWVRASITIAIELYLGSLFLDLINIATK